MADPGIAMQKDRLTKRKRFGFNLIFKTTRTKKSKKRCEWY
jgi:hypothetical protein